MNRNKDYQMASRERGKNWDSCPIGNELKYEPFIELLSQFSACSTISGISGHPDSVKITSDAEAKGTSFPSNSG
jgi:hypothetical protein